MSNCRTLNAVRQFMSAHRRVSTTLKTTPAVKAGVADHVWSVDEMVEPLSSVEPKSTRPAVSD
jgi:hypothetical protein